MRLNQLLFKQWIAFFLNLLLVSSVSFITFHSTPSFAQASEEDAYDPFSDYSEFDEASDEEADIHFFRNGRFLTVGFAGGFKLFTDNLSKVYTPGGTYGLFLSYFFDLRMAMQFGFSTGDFPFNFCVNASQCSGGNVSFTFLSTSGKYYFNTQNVTKGVADLNPYAIAGLSQVYRTYTVSNTVTGTLSNAKDTTWGLDLGGGIELPMMRKKGFFGAQIIFHFVNFSDANSPVMLETYGAYANTIPSGYQFDLMFILGLNF